MNIIVTGAAGFIGFHSALKLLERGDTVIAMDNLNDYYDIRLKKARLKLLVKFDNFVFEKGNLEDEDFINSVFKKYKPRRVLHLGAQAGVRYSLTHPKPYIQSNIVGFFNILEACRHNKIDNLV